MKLIQTKIPNKSPFITSIIKENVQQQLNLKEGDVLFLACGEKVDTVSINYIFIYIFNNYIYIYIYIIIIFEITAIIIRKNTS